MRNKRIRVVTREYIALAPCTIYGGESVFYFTDLSEQQLSVTTIRNEVRTVENIIVGGAWPYANGSLHIGHIAALLPGDVLARYFRAKGNRVFYVSGSDCHGTPITIRAKQEHSTPGEISEHYHREFCDVFKKLGFSYDLYLIANIAILLHPFLPFSSSKVSKWLGVEIKWTEQDIGVKVIPREISILFSKMD